MEYPSLLAGSGGVRVSHRISTIGDEEMKTTKRARLMFYFIVVMMFSATIFVGASVNQQRQRLKNYSTPLVFDNDPYATQQDVQIARQDEQIKNLIKNQEVTAEWIKAATVKLSDHDVEFAQVRYYGYGMLGAFAALQALGFVIQRKIK